MHTSRRLAAVLTAVVATVTLAVPGGVTAAGAAERKPEAVFAKRGPFAVGVLTLAIGDRATEVWYPASKRSVRGKDADAYNIAKYLPQGLQDLLASKNVEAPYTTAAYRDVPPARRDRSRSWSSATASAAGASSRRS